MMMDQGNLDFVFSQIVGCRYCVSPPNINVYTEVSQEFRDSYLMRLFAENAGHCIHPSKAL